MTQYGFHFDGTRCTGCKTCVLACKDKNNLPNDLNFRNVYEYGGGTWSQDGAGCWIHGHLHLPRVGGLQPLRHARCAWRTAPKAPSRRIRTPAR